MEDNEYSYELSDTLTDVEKSLKRIEGLGDGMARSLSRAFKGVVLDGKGLQSVISDIGNTFMDLTLNAAFKPLETLTGGVLDGLFNSLANAIPHAKGGVISAPTYFPMQGGLGVAGEAGAEAILPLQRGSDGRLGVASAASAPVSISMNIQASNAQSFLGAEAEVSAMLLRAVKRGRRAS